jgi:hypothetical protein
VAPAAARLRLNKRTHFEALLERFWGTRRARKFEIRVSHRSATQINLKVEATASVQGSRDLRRETSQKQLDLQPGGSRTAGATSAATVSAVLSEQPESVTVFMKTISEPNCRVGEVWVPRSHAAQEIRGFSAAGRAAQADLLRSLPRLLEPTTSVQYTICPGAQGPVTPRSAAWLTSGCAPHTSPRQHPVSYLARVVGSLFR